MNRFVAELLQVARPAEPAFAPVAVNRLLREAAQKAALARGLPRTRCGSTSAPTCPCSTSTRR